MEILLAFFVIMAVLKLAGIILIAWWIIFIPLLFLIIVYVLVIIIMGTAFSALFSRHTKRRDNRYPF